MSRIEAVFEQTKSENRAALIPYLTAGFPGLESCLDVVKTLADAGADIIELGIPFSDPLADGPTIQKASQIALDQGLDAKSVLGLVEKIRQSVQIPLILMTYYNPVYHYGLGRFAQECFQVGVDGVIIPDLPLEEAKDWLKTAKKKLDTIFLLAPNSSEARIIKTVRLSHGFVYCVSLTGVTGARQALPDYLEEFVWKIKMSTKKPVAVGFGISSPAQVAEIAKIADGVIIGSALIDIIMGNDSQQARLKAVRKFIEEIKSSLHK